MFEADHIGLAVFFFVPGYTAGSRVFIKYLLIRREGFLMGHFRLLTAHFEWVAVRLMYLVDRRSAFRGTRQSSLAGIFRLRCWAKLLFVNTDCIRLAGLQRGWSLLACAVLPCQTRCGLQFGQLELNSFSPPDII